MCTCAESEVVAARGFLVPGSAIPQHTHWSRHSTEVSGMFCEVQHATGLRTDQARPPVTPQARVLRLDSPSQLNAETHIVRRLSAVTPFLIRSKQIF